MTKEYAAELIKNTPEDFVTKQETFNHNAINALDAISEQIKLGNANVFALHCEKLENNFRANPNGHFMFIRFYPTGE